MGDYLRLAETPVWRTASAADVRALIAARILGDAPASRRIGRITLHDHQLSALRRVSDALERFDGALLCDEVGMGKTYVAIAVARQLGGALVVTPAALVPMWKSALHRTESSAELITFEALSRSDLDAFRGKQPMETRRELVVVDEAHHVRTPRTNRYFALERMVRGAKVLLLSATPIHNRRQDLVALLSLFLGSRAQSMTSGELAQCVIRREQRKLLQSNQIPTVMPAKNHTVDDEPAMVEALMNLPPPVPVRDGGIATALVGRGLVHQWASSEAALREALRRRIARATALCASLEAGTYPTLKELERWVYDDGALQLGFPELLSSPTIGHGQLLGGLRAHLSGLQWINEHFKFSTLDEQRAETLRRIWHSGPDRKIVAFSQYTETVAMLYRRLVRHGYVAMLTAHGARVAGGPLTRSEAIARFAPLATRSLPPPRAERIHLLLTTDLLSEGVNLQDADTVVHLDIPWTAARMEQRVGRLARLGSRHKEVYVHVIRPPASAAAVLNAELTVKRKQYIARAEESTPRKVERLRSLLEAWREAPKTSRTDTSSVIVAAAISDVSGLIAAVSVDGATQLVVADAGVLSAELEHQLRVCSLPMLESSADSEAVTDAIASIERWCATQRAADAAGVVDSHALRRRALIARIDQSIESAAPHQRSARLALASRARRVVTSTQCADVETELETLLHSSLTERDWLAAVANLGTQQASPFPSAHESLRIHAILLLTLRPPRSPTQPDPESP